MAEESHRRSRNLSFSLGTLMLFTAMVAMVVSLLVSAGNNRRLTRTNESLMEENDRLRDEVGELSIEDESQFHAIRTASDNDLEWVWRVWVPEGQGYRLRVVGGEIPKEGWPSGRGGSMAFSTPGEHVVRYTIRREPTDDYYSGSLSTRGGSVGSDRHAWVEWPSRAATMRGVGTTTHAFPTDRIMELFRYRVSQASSSEDIEDPSEGFLIWLERVK